MQVIPSYDERHTDKVLGISLSRFRARERSEKSTAPKPKDRNGKLKSMFEGNYLDEVTPCGSNQDEAAQPCKSAFNHLPDELSNIEDRILSSSCPSGSR